MSHGIRIIARVSEQILRIYAENMFHRDSLRRQTRRRLDRFNRKRRDVSQGDVPWKSVGRIYRVTGLNLTCPRPLN